MKLFRWFRGRGRRHAANSDSGADQPAAAKTQQVDEPIQTARAPAVARRTPDAFAWEFLKWTSRHRIHGPTDIRRIEILMAEFADAHDLMPLEPKVLFRGLDQLRIGSGEREVHVYEYGFAEKRADGRRLTTRFYVLPQRFPIQPAPRALPAPPRSPQFDLFKQDR
jgi:hypothetical protein